MPDINGKDPAAELRADLALQVMAHNNGAGGNDAEAAIDVCC